MAEPKPFASLSSGLLARKGTAVPAMRRQMMGLMGSGTHGSAAHDIHSQDDLGWNDMGEDMPRHSDPLSVVGLTPMPYNNGPVPMVEEVEETAAIEAPVPVVVEQRRVLAERVATPRVAPIEQIIEQAIVEPAIVEQAFERPAAKAATRKAKAAFTLRLDPERHLRLRLACAVDNRSAQQIVTEALDAYLSAQPQIDALAEQLPRPTGAKN